MRRQVVLILAAAMLACADPAEETPPQVELRWDRVLSDDVVGYNVYRSEDPDRGFERVNPNPIVEPRYADTTVERGKTYEYRVTSVSASGLESAFSEATSKTIR